MLFSEAQLVSWFVAVALLCVASERLPCATSCRSIRAMTTSAVETLDFSSPAKDRFDHF